MRINNTYIVRVKEEDDIDGIIMDGEDIIMKMHEGAGANYNYVLEYDDGRRTHLIPLQYHEASKLLNRDI